MAVLTGRPAPDFRCPAVLPDGSITDDFHFASAVQGRPALLLFYPADFTTPCPSELRALEQQWEAFTARNVVVVTVSTDSVLSHTQWRDGELGPVRYTMAADPTQQIARDYDVQTAQGVCFRATFLIDARGVVRSQQVNDLALDCNIPELLRQIDLLQAQA